MKNKMQKHKKKNTLYNILLIIPKYDLRKVITHLLEMKGELNSTLCHCREVKMLL